MEVVFSKQSFNDFEKIKQFPSLVKKVKALVKLIAIDPYKTPPSYEKLLGFKNVCSRRLNVQHRLIYEVREKENTVVVFACGPIINKGVLKPLFV